MDDKISMSMHGDKLMEIINRYKQRKELDPKVRYMCKSCLGTGLGQIQKMSDGTITWGGGEVCHVCNGVGIIDWVEYIKSSRTIWVPCEEEEE